MLKKIALFLFASFLCCGLFAQSTTGFVTYDISDLQTGSKSKKITEYLGSDDKGGNYFLKENIGWSTDAFFLDLFGKNLTLQKEAELPLKWDKLTVSLLRVLNLNDHFYLFAYDRDSKTDIGTVYLQEIDRATFTFKGKAKPIVTKQMANNQFGGFSVITSENDSYIAVVGNLNQKGNDFEQIDVTVFDSTMQKVWSKEIKLPYTEKLFWIQSRQLDRKGNFYVLGKNYFDKAVDKKKGEPNYNFRIIAYKENGNKIKDLKIEVADKFINTIWMSPMNDGSKLLCGGFYSAKGTYSIKGVIMLTIDLENLSIESNKSKPFDSELLNRLVTTKKESKTGELFEYDITDFIKRSDGGFLLIGEQSYIVTHTYTDGNGNTHTTTTYHYNNLILVNINPELDIEWIKDIPKQQVGPYLPQSYALSISNGNLYFLFNQSTKQEKMYATDGKMEDKTLGEEEENDKSSQKESQVLVAVKVEPDGTRYSQKLWKYEYGKMCSIEPAYCEQVNENEMFFYGSQPGKYQIGFFYFK